MLPIVIPGREMFDQETSSFTYTKGETLQLEHSLLSLSKWESKWCKPFLNKAQKTDEEMLDYIRCMTITQNVNPDIYTAIPGEVIDQINKYINSSMTATVIHKHQPSPPSREEITSELIYYWMVAFNIPFECQKWHLNRLLTLINVCSVKNQPPKKQGRKEMLNERAALNASRRAQFHTKG